MISINTILNSSSVQQITIWSVARSCHWLKTRLIWHQRPKTQQQTADPKEKSIMTFMHLKVPFVPTYFCKASLFMNSYLSFVLYVSNKGQIDTSDWNWPQSSKETGLPKSPKVPAISGPSNIRRFIIAQPTQSGCYEVPVTNEEPQDFRR